MGEGLPVGQPVYLPSVNPGKAGSKRKIFYGLQQQVITGGCPSCRWTSSMVAMKKRKTQCRAQSPRGIPIPLPLILLVAFSLSFPLHVVYYLRKEVLRSVTFVGTFRRVFMNTCGSNILKMVYTDRSSVTTEPLLEMPSGMSNGHVTDDIKWHYCRRAGVYCRPGGGFAPQALFLVFQFFGHLNVKFPHCAAPWKVCTIHPIAGAARCSWRSITQNRMTASCSWLPWCRGLWSVSSILRESRSCCPPSWCALSTARLASGECCHSPCCLTHTTSSHHSLKFIRWASADCCVWKQWILNKQSS